MSESPSGTILTNEVSKMTIKLSEETEPMSVEAGPSTRVALPPAISDDTLNLLVTRPKAPPVPSKVAQTRALEDRGWTILNNPVHHSNE